MNENTRKMDWHLFIAVVTIVIPILGTIIGYGNSISKRFNNLEKEMIVIKTVLIMKDVMPKELAINNIGKIEEKK